LLSRKLLENEHNSVALGVEGTGKIESNQLSVDSTIPIRRNRQNVGRPQRASQTHYRDADADDPSRNADDDSEDTAAQLRSAAAVVR
jgi:hypothetical protein